MREPTACNRVKPRSSGMRRDSPERHSGRRADEGERGLMQADSRPSAECWLATALFRVPDRRASPRVRTVCLAVKVNRGGKAAILRARNLSDDGMMLSTPAPLDVGERVLINLSEKLAVHGTVLGAGNDGSGV